MQRVNVRQSQIRECIEKSLFAVDRLPTLQTGELLLLQLVKEEARLLGKLHSRIEFALIYDHYEIDHTGAISRQHWPSAGKIWKYILFVLKQYRLCHLLWKIWNSPQITEVRQIHELFKERTSCTYYPSFGEKWTGMN